MFYGYDVLFVLFLFCFCFVFYYYLLLLFFFRVFSPLHNWKACRDLMKNSPCPCIPYIGFFFFLSLSLFSFSLLFFPVVFH